MTKREPRAAVNGLPWAVATLVGVVAGSLVALPVLTRSDREVASTLAATAARPVAPPEMPPPEPMVPILPGGLTGEAPAPPAGPPSNPIPSFIRAGPAANPRVAITIDDLFGATGSEQLASVLDFAEGRDVRLTLFPTGGALRDAIRSGHQETWRRAVRDGHEIGNHTFTHANLTRLSDEQIREELTGTQDMLNQVLGPDFAYHMRLMRPPGGAGGFEGTGNTRIMRIATELGYSMVMWGIDSNYTGGFDSYVDKIMGTSGARNGSIILLHFPTFSPDNVATLIDRLRAEKHLEPVTVSGLFPS